MICKDLRKLEKFAVERFLPVFAKINKDKIKNKKKIIK